MKRILDHLMSRQQKLLSSLDPPPPPKRTGRGHVLTADQRVARLAAEEAAIGRAFSHLAEGKLDAALELLLPFAEGAVDTRTLTTLARIRSAQGDFPGAFDYLTQAEALSPSDPKVVHFMAEWLRQQGRYAEEVQYRRRAAFSTAAAPGDAYVKLITALAKTAPGNLRPALGEVRLALDRIKAANDLTPAQRIEGARVVFGLPGFEEEALEQYVAADPPTAGERDVSAKWESLRQWCESSGQALHTLGDTGESGRQLQLAELNNAVVMPSLQWTAVMRDGEVALDGLACRRLHLRSEDPDSPLLMTGARNAVFRLPQSMPRVHEPVLMLGGDGSYHHDLVEYFGALAIAESLGVSDGVRLLVNNKAPPYVGELLSLLDIAPERLLYWDPRQMGRFDNLWLPTRLTAGGTSVDPLLPRWFKQRFGRFLARSTPVRKLYISRAGAARRRVQNEPELICALQALGFECVRPESLSLLDQVTLFSQASHIVSVSGSGLTNMLFAPIGARVCILQSRQLHEARGDLSFESLARACGHRGVTVACLPSRLATGERAADADLTADVAMLRAAITRLDEDSP